jgi:hypothetical protein
MLVFKQLLTFFKHTVPLENHLCTLQTFATIGWSFQLSMDVFVFNQVEAKRPILKLKIQPKQLQH